MFEYTGSEVCGLEWGRLYREYHGRAYSKDAVTRRVDDLLSDTQVTNWRDGRRELSDTVQDVQQGEGEQIEKKYGLPEG